MNAPQRAYSIMKLPLSPFNLRADEDIRFMIRWPDIFGRYALQHMLTTHISRLRHAVAPRLPPLTCKCHRRRRHLRANEESKFRLS